MSTPAFLLEELLRFRKSDPIETAELVSLNHDQVCQKVQDQIGILLDCFEKYQHISYLVQGPRDQGVDVLLKGGADDEPEKYIAIQIKSYKEIADKDSDLSKQLKAGLFDATQRYDDAMQRYYILLCGDSKKHFKRISALTNEFSRTKNVRVIEPREIHAFIALSPATIGAIVDRHLSKDDYVRKEARGDVSGLDEAELYFILACLCWSFENSSDLLPDDFFTENTRLAELAEKYGEGAVEEVLCKFEDTDLEVYAEPASKRLRTEHYRAVRALYYDIQVRYQEEPEQLFNHLFEFLKAP